MKINTNNISRAEMREQIMEARRQGMFEGLLAGKSEGLASGRAEGRREGKKNGMEILAHLIKQLRAGRSCEELQKEGYDEEELNLAVSCVA